MHDGCCVSPLKKLVARIHMNFFLIWGRAFWKETMKIVHQWYVAQCWLCCYVACMVSAGPVPTYCGRCCAASVRGMTCSLCRCWNSGLRNTPTNSPSCCTYSLPGPVAHLKERDIGLSLLKSDVHLYYVYCVHDTGWQCDVNVFSRSYRVHYGWYYFRHCLYLFVLSSVLWDHSLGDWKDI